MIGGGVKLNTRNTELFHYGVKGMKWGVRRKRNEHNKNYTDKQRKNGSGDVWRSSREAN